MRICFAARRLGGVDEVGVGTAGWIAALRGPGVEVTRAAAEFVDRLPSDVVLREMSRTVVGRLCAGHDLLILADPGTLWHTPEDAAVWQRGVVEHVVPTIARHHDVTAAVPLPPRFLHVVMDQLAYRELAARQPELVALGALRVAGHRVDTAAQVGGDREGVRRALGVGPEELLVLHPVGRDVPSAVEFTLTLDTLVKRPVRYWLSDPEDEPLDASARAALADAPDPVRAAVADPADRYAAADLVLLPSTRDGSVLPVLEAAAARRPVAAGPSGALKEIRAAGIAVFDPGRPGEVARTLSIPSAREAMLEANAAAVERHYAAYDLPGELSGLVGTARRLAGQR